MPAPTASRSSWTIRCSSGSTSVTRSGPLPRAYAYTSGTQAFDIHTGSAASPEVGGHLDGYRDGLVTQMVSQLVSPLTGAVVSRLGLDATDGRPTPPVSVPGVAWTTIGPDHLYQVTPSTIAATR